MTRRNVKVLFGKHIRKLRQAKGWSQEEFAAQAGLDRSYIGGVERGERNISLENICLLADCLDLPPSRLFDGWESAARGVTSSSQNEEASS